MRLEHAEPAGTLRRWHSCTLPGLEVGFCDRVVHRGSNRYVFDKYTITLVEAGNGVFFRGRSTAPVSAGQMALSSPGDVIAADCGSAGFTCRNLYLSTELVAELHREAPVVHRSPFSALSFANRQLFEALRAATNALDHPDGDLARDTIVLPTLQRLLVSEPAEFPRISERHAVRRVRERLLDSLADPPNLDELSRLARLNKYHLLRTFRSKTGLPPHAYLLHARISRARSLIARGMSAFEAGVETGFADQAHFTRTFKRLVGLTPGHYQSSLAGQRVHVAIGL